MAGGDPSKCAYTNATPDLNDKITNYLLEDSGDGSTRCDKITKCSVGIDAAINRFNNGSYNFDYIDSILVAAMNESYENNEIFKSILFDFIGFRSPLSNGEVETAFDAERRAINFVSTPDGGDFQEEFISSGRLNERRILETNEKLTENLRDKTLQAIEQSQADGSLNKLEIDTLTAIATSLNTFVQLLNSVSACTRFIATTEQRIEEFLRSDKRKRYSVVDKALTGDGYSEEDKAQNAVINDALNKGVGAGISQGDVRIYQEQCFVLSQLSNLIQIKKSYATFVPRLPYVSKDVYHKTTNTKGQKTYEAIPIDKNAPILIHGEPFGFMNRMVQYPSTRKLFNLTTAQLSSLVPTIRLYRIETDPGTGKDIGSTEIKFDPNPAVASYEGGETTALDLFMRKGKRGYGVGLKNFNFTFHGSDPFAVKKAIQADLTLFATSFGDLITERNGYKFADLALKTGKTPQDLRQNLDIIDQQNLDKLNFRLKAVVGWSIPHQNVGDFSPSEKDAVRDSFVSLNLTPTTHEFNFDEMGGVVFKINYLAYIEDYFNNQTFNIFSDPQTEARREARKLFYEFLESQNCDADSLDIIKEADAQVLQFEKSQSFSSILKRLRRQDKLLSYNVSYDEISDFLQGKKMNLGSLVPVTFDAASVGAVQQSFLTYTEALSASDAGSVREETDRVTNLTKEDNSVTFFFIGDLLSVVMQGIDESLEELTKTQKQLDFRGMIESQAIYREAASFLGLKGPKELIGKLQIDDSAYKEFLNKRVGKERKESLLKAKAQFEKLRLVLGPIEIADPFQSNKIQFCSLGDIPLSLNYFTEFLTKKMIGRNEVFYPLTNFVKDLVNEVIKNFLNNDGCFDFGIRQKLKLNSTAITAYNRTENKFHSGAGYEIAESEFEANGKAQIKLDDITYFIGNNTMSINKETGKNEPDFGFGNIMNLNETPLQPILQIAGESRSPVNNPPVQREMNYYIFYAGRAYPTDLMTGNEKLDTSNGIFHYVLGKDRGIVKNISLDRTDLKGLKELRFEKEGFDGLTQLREVYNANIDCFLNVQALPGSYIYVDPRGFSPEAGINYSQFGIGGYYMITRAEHSIGVGKADTKIVAKWVADTNGRIESGENESDKSKVVERNPKAKRKCIAFYRQSAKASPRVLKEREEDIKRGMGKGAGARKY